MTSSTYRFIAMYILISIVLTMVASIQTNKSDDSREYDLGNQDKFSEISQSKDNLITQSEETIQANQYSITQGWGNQMTGGSFLGALTKGFIPSVFEYSLLSGQNVSGLERSAIITMFIFRLVIGIFMGLEIWFLWKGKVS